MPRKTNQLPASRPDDDVIWLGAGPPEGKYWWAGRVKISVTRVAGTSYRASTLEALRKLDPPVEGPPQFAAALVREPRNPHDASAVKVVSVAGQVGYLPRQLAPNFQAVLHALERRGYDGISCDAYLCSSDAARLRLPSPDTLADRPGLFDAPVFGRTSDGRFYSCSTPYFLF